MSSSDASNSKRPAEDVAPAPAPTGQATANYSAATTTTTAPSLFGFDAIIAPQKRSKMTEAAADHQLTTTTATTATFTAPAPPIEDSNLADLLESACKISIPPDEQANKDAFLRCLRDIDRSLDYINEQAHQWPDGWDKKKRDAAEKTIQALSNLPRRQDDNDDDSDESDPFGRTTNPAPTVGLSVAEKNFINALPSCIPLSSGFLVIRPNASNICWCPCGPNLKPWRDSFRLHVTYICGNHVTKFTPNALMDHLKKEGGRYEEKKKFVPLGDIYHHATRLYLQNMFADWFGKGFAHKALYPPLSLEHNRAVSEEIRRIERAVVLAEREKNKAQKEKEELEKALSLFDNPRREAVERLEKLREKFNVQKKDKQEAMSNQELDEYKALISNYFETNKVGKLKDGVVKIVVKSMRGCNFGFSLQTFFDENYVSTKNYTTKSMYASSVLFSDDSDKNITKAILSVWNIVYDNQGDYIIETKASKIEGTAVDQGGPSRQFLTDIFKQFDILSVKVGKERVKLFETSDSGVTVVTDELLEYNISLAMKKSGVDEDKVKAAAVKQSKDYVRALGRIMLHSIANKYIIPAKAMPPFFMNVMFRGYNKKYHRYDILHHIGHSINKDFLDGDGNKLTPELFFNEYIPATFIHSRKKLLGGLRDGLTIGGCSSLDASTVSDLAKGCGMAHNLFFTVPLEAINKIYFSKLTFNVEDLLAIIVPVYGDVDHPDMKLSMERKAELIQQQEIFFDGDFKRYLKESAEEDSNFLVKFVECVTGYNYLPHDGSHQIQIEFSFAQTEGLPLFHSCTRDLIIPGYDYYWSDYKDFKDVKMNKTIDAVYNQFAMK